VFECIIKEIVCSDNDVCVEKKRVTAVAEKFSLKGSGSQITEYLNFIKYQLVVVETKDLCEVFETF
jgi:hypothetical protein